MEKLLQTQFKENKVINYLKFRRDYYGPKKKGKNNGSNAWSYDF